MKNKRLHRLFVLDKDNKILEEREIYCKTYGDVFKTEAYKELARIGNVHIQTKIEDVFEGVI